MKKVIQLTESDLTNIVKRVIKENAAKDSLIDMIKEDGWWYASELVGGVENLKKLAGIETPMDYLNLFNDLEMVQSGMDSKFVLFSNKNVEFIDYDRKYNEVNVNYIRIWFFLEKSFGLDYSEIKKLVKVWLGKVYNLKGVKIKTS